MVEIPEEKAIIIAEHHRAQAQAAPTPANAQWHREVADLLDSQPPTLREQVAATLRDKQSDATSWKQDANAVLADASFFVADRAYTVVSISQVHATAATATATQYVQVTKDTGTQAPGTGTDLLTNNSNNGFTLNGTANTVQAGTLTTAGAALDLAAGDRLSADFTATTAPVAGVTITAMLKPKAS